MCKLISAAIMAVMLSACAEPAVKATNPPTHGYSATVDVVSGEGMVTTNTVVGGQSW